MRLFSIAFLILISLVPARGLFANDTNAPAKAVTVEQCLVKLVDEALVPAEEAGVLDVVAVKEGAQVAKDELLGRIDDKLVRIQHRAAKAEMEVAAEKIEQNKISREYQESAYKVAELQYTRRRDKNKEVVGSTPQLELIEFWLKADGAMKQIDVSKSEEKVAKAEYRVKEVQVEMAAEAIEKRQIKSPLDGIVVKVEKNLGEWVQPGDPVFRVISLEKLRVRGRLKRADYRRAALRNRPVVVEAVLTNGRKEKFQGRVVFVDPLLLHGEKYSADFEFWAEVENRKEDGVWLLLPESFVDMTVQLQ